MKDPFDLVSWALAIGIAWVVLISLTGLDDWLKSVMGKHQTNKELAAKIEALERRVAELERQS